jgi:hypothetical protein
MRLGVACAFCRSPGDPKFLLMIEKCGPIRRRLEVDELIGLDRLPPWL